MRFRNYIRRWLPIAILVLLIVCVHFFFYSQKEGLVSTIPQTIYQTHKSKDFVESNSNLSEATETWKAQKGFSYHFYDNTTCDEFMRTHFQGDVYDAYNKLVMGVMKADIWRYCIIYKFGGIYADVDTVCLKTPDDLLDETAQFVVVPEPTHGKEKSPFFCQWVFAAPAGSLVLKKVIDTVVERIKEWDLNMSDKHLIHRLTRPAVFTDAIERFLEENNAPTYSNKNEYIGNKSLSIKVLPQSFHEDNVKHLFAGDGGWKVEKKSYE